MCVFRCEAGKVAPWHDGCEFASVGALACLKCRDNLIGCPLAEACFIVRCQDQVLEPLQLPETQKQRLSAALALTLGGEAIMAMKDVCKLNNAEAKAVLRWSALALLRAAMEEK